MFDFLTDELQGFLLIHNGTNVPTTNEMTLIRRHYGGLVSLVVLMRTSMRIRRRDIPLGYMG